LHLILLSVYYLLSNKLGCREIPDFNTDHANYGKYQG
jgi:hypothetical protein